MRNVEHKNYPLIDPLESFWELLNLHGQKLLEELEPDYCKRFIDCKKLGLTPRQTHAACDSLLRGRFKGFVELIEALHEVRYYWKRLSEISRLLESAPPTTSPYQINNAQWFVYNLDSYWYAVYGLEERLITFLTRLERCFQGKEKTEIRAQIRNYVQTIKQIHIGTKKARDPMVHMRSQGVVGWRDGHDWEASLLVEEKMDFIEIYDNRMLHDKEFYLGYIRAWVPMINETLDNIFKQLSLFPIGQLR